MTDLTNVRILVCTAPIKMNLSFDSLMGLAQETLQSTVEELNRLKRWIYGRKRERVIEGEGQRHLFDLEPLATDEPEGAIPEQPLQQVAAHSRRRRRELDLSKLPHYRHELDLSPAEKTCSCCGRVKDCIGKDETKILDYVPAKLEVHVHVRPKYACRYCKDGVVSPPPPERPIARGIAGPGLIAQIVVSKFGDHQPLYRQEDFFARHGLHIARSTQCDWVKAAAELLGPLHERQKELVLQSPVLWTDDTPVTVLVGGEEGTKPSAERTGCSLAASRPVHALLCCSPFSLEPSVTGSSPGPICVRSSCACMPTIRDSTTCSQTAGRQPIQKWS